MRGAAPAFAKTQRALPLLPRSRVSLMSSSSDDDSDADEHTGPIPVEIIRAVQEGDRELVEQWLVDTDAAYVNATLPQMLRLGNDMRLDVRELRLLTLCIFCDFCIFCHRDYTGVPYNAPANRRNMYQSDYTVQMLAIARMLLEHGADANLDGRGMHPLEYTWQFHSRGNALPWFDLLLEFGANPNVTVRDASPSNRYTTLLGKIICECGLTMVVAPEQVPRIATALLRAGARADSPHDDGTNPTWVLEQRRRDLEQGRLHWEQSVQDEEALALPLEYHDLDPHFIALSKLITGVAAAGSFKRWLRRGAHRDVLTLRTQIQRGRAALPAPRRRPRAPVALQRNALAFVLKQGDNGVVWKILSFWREAG